MSRIDTSVLGRTQNFASGGTKEPPLGVDVTCGERVPGASGCGSSRGVCSVVGVGGRTRVVDVNMFLSPWLLSPTGCQGVSSSSQVGRGRGSWEVDRATCEDGYLEDPKVTRSDQKGWTTDGRHEVLK